MIPTPETISLEQLTKNYLNQFPEKTEAEKTNLIKIVREYYRAKGAPAAYKFFFKAAYNASCEFEFPGERVLRVSGGNWLTESTIYAWTTDDATNLEGVTMVGRASGASFGVESVFVQEENIYRLTISNVLGKIQIGEEVVGGGISFTAMAVIGSLKIVDPGTGGNVVGEEFNITGGFSDALATISRVDEIGRIRAVRIIIPGFGFSTTPNNLTLPSGAVISSKLSTIFTSSGFYLDDASRLERSCVLQDGQVFQNYSYIIRSSKETENWINDVKQYIHPAGLYVSGICSVFAGDSRNGDNIVSLNTQDWFGGNPDPSTLSSNSFVSFSTTITQLDSTNNSSVSLDEIEYIVAIESPGIESFMSFPL